MSLLISLKSESVKIKRSAVFYLCLIVALIVPAVLFFDTISPNDGGTEIEKMELDKYFRTGQQIFNFIFMPLFIILLSTLLLQIEYRNNTWKQVLTSPQKLLNVFLSKFITLHLLIILFIASFLIFLAAGAFLIDLIEPGVFKKDLFSIEDVLLATWRSYVSIFAISAIQFWIGLRFRNFIAPLAIGFFLWIMAPLSLFQFHWANANNYPYSFPILLSDMNEMPDVRIDKAFLQILSVAYGLVFLAVGFIEFKLRRVKIGI